MKKLTIEGEVIKKGDLLTEGAYLDCRFEKVDFSELDLFGYKFMNCRFIGCNWTETKVELTRFQEVCFVESKLMGIDLTLCDPNFLSLSFEKSLLQGCNFTEMVLKQARFLWCRVKDCHFTQANLTRSSFQGSELKGTTFHQTILENCNFCEASHYAIDPRYNRLKGAKFSQPEALSLLSGLGIVIE